VGERSLHTREVAGSKPAAPILFHALRLTYPGWVSRVYLLERRQRIELPIERAFAFYGEAHNLERITPPWLGFEVTTPRPIEMGEGTLIEYRLKLHGVPVRWKTRITAWEPPHRFVDVQLSGPYSLWEHTHAFEEDGPEATVIRDRVRYAIPFGSLGELANRLLVRRDLKQIFGLPPRRGRYGCCSTEMMFPEGSSNQAICGPGLRTMPFSSWSKPS
jgi:ligand-binding SRPBCC domain-containing protein